MTSPSTRPPRRACVSWRLLALAGLLALGSARTLAAEPEAAGAPSAKPTIVLPDGAGYFGRLKDGLLDGRGRLQWEGGQSYEGTFRRGRMEGQGRYVGLGYVYEGAFMGGAMQGRGKLTRDDGTVYDGEFVQNRMDGFGKLSFGGYVYEGRFVKDKPSGRGRLVEPSGLTIEGRFDGSYQPVGDATITTPQGARYEGALQDGRTPHGPGTLTLPDKTVLLGEFRHGELAGNGHIRYPDGSSYEGAVRDNRAHGEGELHFANGDIYRGRFARGEPDGRGRREKAATARPRQTASVQEGFWRAGEYLGIEGDGTLEESPGLAARNNEAALYNQHALLQAQLDALQASRPGAPQMYALFVAGDGGQEVFRREVAYVDELFARRFATRGRSVSLVNSRSSAERLPLATTRSIDLALKGLAQKMDRERDMLFVFLTSHGSKTHELVLEMNEMDLPWLPAARLGALLKDSGIRNQVIVVSACYSGGFVPALQGERTWVITAARADRSSFGCADGNDFTYFGRALFKESLPGAATLSAAVEGATRKVRQWEARDGVKGGAAGAKDDPDAAAARHSEPQSVVAPAFRAEVDAWFKAHPAVPGR